MIENALITGALMGLASALHRGAMCGGVACGALLLLGSKAPRDRFRHLALMQVGRTLTYASIGAAGAFVGSWVLVPQSAHGFVLMQWAAVAALVWVGMTTAGVAPRIVALDRGMVRASQVFGGLVRPVRTRPIIGPIGIGMAWGLNACPMMYAAAFGASLTGSVMNGTVFMMGFGLGTIPAVVTSGTALLLLAGFNRRPGFRAIAGAAIVLAAVASIAIPLPPIKQLCLR